jgi:Ca2+-binding RTX toxin-like protein
MMRRAMLMVATMALSLLVASGVALALSKVGGPGPDTLRGTNKADTLVGKGGNDVLLGLAGPDHLLGGPGKDWVLSGNKLFFGRGDKKLVGGPGNDGIHAGQGSDNALGGTGNDLLIDGSLSESSHDNFAGGAGNDIIIVNHTPAFEDRVVCGSGFDWVGADTKDVVAPDCEKVGIIRTAAQEGEFFEPIMERFARGLAPFPE